MSKLIAIFESDSKIMHLFFSVEKKKKRLEGGDLSLCLSPRRDHSDTLPDGPRPTRAEDPDEP